jgi:hypothetical protein
MNYKITHIETDKEIIIKFTIWEQTFSLYPFSKDEEYKREQTQLYKSWLKKALDNLKLN